MLSDFINFLGKFFWQITSNYESKARISVLQKPKVAELISRYSLNKVKIKSIYFKDIEDPFFIHRLLPQYIDHEISSLVLIEAPKQNIVFLEDEKSESLIEMNSDMLKQNLESLTEDDRKIYSQHLA